MATQVVGNQFIDLTHQDLELLNGGGLLGDWFSTVTASAGIGMIAGGMAAGAPGAVVGGLIGAVVGSYIFAGARAAETAK